MEPELITTADGSHSLFVPHLNEHYHSIHGAIQESNHVFIKNGLENSYATGKANVSILEVGLGTGLNAFLSYLFCIDKKHSSLSVNYTAVEPHPLPTAITHRLNYSNYLIKLPSDNTFNHIHQSEWGKNIEITPSFILHKIGGTVQNAVLTHGIDLIYFDAFGPRVQPEMWDFTIFEKLITLMNPGGILVTYCAKGEVRRTMEKAGFMMERLPGPPGKREMLRARKV